MIAQKLVHLVLVFVIILGERGREGVRLSQNLSEHVDLINHLWLKKDASNHDQNDGTVSLHGMRRSKHKT
jgi:hypothetical protein